MVKKGGGKSSPKGSPKKKQSEAARSFALSKRLSSEKVNPFDKFSNAKKKHEVVNRRVKGEDRNVGRARAKAVEERRKRLLGDYQRSKKTNVFNDRRFGEDDADMSLEEKMFARFQKEKVRKARNLSQFNLDDGEDTEVLTHKGQVLGDSNYGNSGEWSDNEDEENLDRDVVNTMHFGGGMVPKSKAAAGEEGEDEQPKGNRMDKQLTALQEIVMKSKMAKAQKKEAKDEQEVGREKLDQDFEALMQGNLLEMQPIGRDFERKRLGKDGKQSAEKGEFDDYDKNMMEMAFEAKVKAADRTKTAEELAVEEKNRLEEAEKLRIKRMREGPDVQSVAELDEDGDMGLLNVAPQAKESKKKKDDVKAIEGFESEEEEEEDQDESDDSEEGSDDDDDDDAFDSDEEEAEPATAVRAPRSKAYPVSSSSSSSSSAGGLAKKTKSGSSTVAAVKINADMPHTLPCPADLEAFRELCDKYARNGPDYVEMVTRIVGYHSVKLPGQQGVDNKSKMHNFLGILMAEFSAIGDGLAYTTTSQDGADLMLRLDGLSGIMFQVCKEMESSVSSLWAKALKQMLAALQKRLRDYAHGVRDASTWPSLGKVLFLQLLGRIYSVTDMQHALVTPAMLLMCQYLTQCPVSSLQDLSTGLMVSSVLVDFTEGSKRIVPEVTSFLCRVLAVVADNHARHNRDAVDVDAGVSSSTFDVNRLRWLSLLEKETSKAKKGVKRNREEAIGNTKEEWQPKKIAWDFFRAAESPQDDTTVDVALERERNLTVVGTCLSLMQQLLGRHGASPAFPEIASPLLSALMTVSTSTTPSSGDDNAARAAFMRQLRMVLESCGTQVTRKVESRKPLTWRQKKLSTLEAKNPEYSMNYTFKKDNDADSERAKMKQLQRQLKRETKAAQRELKRDSEFLDREAFSEKMEAQQRLRDERGKNFAFMEEQQATINQQVRMGGGLMKGGGSGVIKGKVHKREKKKGGR